MFDRADNFIASYRRGAGNSTKQLPSALLATGSLLLSLAVFFGASQPSIASMKKQILSQPSPSTDAPIPMQTPIPAVAQSHLIPDGIYLYGQSSEPEQIGAEYMVFESRQDRVVGALYLPQSSFDCFYGRRESQALSLSIINSYQNTTHPYAVALSASETTVASTGDVVGNFELQGLQRIDEISQNDTRILEMCKENYQDEVWE
ncbi:hypothetical protein IQ235_13390 [Oscillatoriales cyanobacterium LEGE 11467]|uniref:Uncharacterized protein n=1 Tax=Zarconia navalis LEGE 11467 TaxID=1828826 RepID=A0A928VY51_9CYAN|nr:hypothetical protein [Zarconia navalis]MBE9041774.1 hypothetical protein [Zarconia navalis LEGE 11467]